MGSEMEGGTSYDAKAESYIAIQRTQAKGCGGIHRGQTVYIAGEPGLQAYRVLAIDPMHGMAIICRVGDATETWRVPIAALSKID